MKKTAAFRTVSYRPAGTVIARTLTSVMRAALGYRCHVLVAPRSTAYEQTSAATVAWSCATCYEPMLLHPSPHSAHRRTAHLESSRSQRRLLGNHSCRS